MTKNLLATLTTIVDYILDQPAGDGAPVVVVSPVLTHPVRGYPHFHVCSRGPRGFRSDEVIGAEDVRAALLAALLARRPIVVHDCDDELYAIKLCEMLWPGETVTRLRKLIEAQRKGSLH